MKKTVYGYARVSSINQNEDRQVDKLREAGIQEENIFIDKISGMTFDRPNYNALMQKLNRGDVIYILSVDRLGRDYKEIQAQWRIITEEKGADIVVLDMNFLDTRTKKGIVDIFIADQTLQIMSFVAHTEREYIKERQAQGIAAAKARGIQFGRKRIPLVPGFEEIIQDYRGGRLSANEAANSMGISRATFFRRLKDAGTCSDNNTTVSNSRLLETDENP